MVATECVAPARIGWLERRPRGRMMRRIRNREGLKQADEIRREPGARNPRTKLVHIMTLMRTNAGINKTERAGRKDAQIGFVDALQRAFPMAAVRVSRMSWLDSPRDLVQRNIGNI